MSEESGIVTLEELPENGIFVELEIEFKEKISSLVSNRKKIAKELGISERILSHWLDEKSLLRLDIFKTIVKYLNIQCNGIKIMSLRRRFGGKVENPKLPTEKW